MNLTSLKTGMIGNVVTRYLRESKEELGKVSWPTRHTAHTYAGMVIVISIGLGAFFFLLDIAFGKGLTALISLTQ